MQLNLLDAIVRVRAEVLLSSKCCKEFTASPEMLKNFTSDKVSAVCSTDFSGEDNNDTDLEPFTRCEYDKYIKFICFFGAFFSSIAWLYIQMSIWQP